MPPIPAIWNQPSPYGSLWGNNNNINQCFLGCNIITYVNRDTGAPKRGFGSVLPRHPTDHGKRYTNSSLQDITCKSIHGVGEEHKYYSDSSNTIMKVF